MCLAPYQCASCLIAYANLRCRVAWRLNLDVLCVIVRLPLFVKVGVKEEVTPAEVEEVLEVRPMSMDMSGHLMSMDMTPSSPSMGGMPLWTPPSTGQSLSVQ